MRLLLAITLLAFLSFAAAPSASARPTARQIKAQGVQTKSQANSVRLQGNRSAVSAAREQTRHDGAVALKAFSDSALGFHAEIPRAWTVDRNPGGVTITDTTDAKAMATYSMTRPAAFSINLRQDVVSFPTPDAFFEWRYNYDLEAQAMRNPDDGLWSSMTAVTATDVTVDGHPGRRFDFARLLEDPRTLSIVIVPVGDRAYVFTMDARQKRPLAESAFSSLLASATFSEPRPASSSSAKSVRHPSSRSRASRSR